MIFFQLSVFSSLPVLQRVVPTDNKMSYINVTLARVSIFTLNVAHLSERPPWKVLTQTHFKFLC